MQDQLAAFEALDTEIWSISPDKPDKLRAFRDEKDVKIPLLVDRDSQTIKAYGVLNEGQGSVPHPAVVLVDRSGTVRFVHMDENFRRRPEVDLLITAVRKIEASSPGA